MSNREAMQQLTDRFMNDAQFREEMKQDPEGAGSAQDFSWTTKTGKLCAA